MPAPPLTTTVSTKGQVILPKPLRERRRWNAGVRLEIVESDEGVLLRPAPAFAAIRPEDVRGSLAYHGTPKTLAEMDAAITAEVRRRHARGRY